MEGAGVHLSRAFGYDEVPQFDPFLMLDDFRSDVPEHYRLGFPWHPHRGIETITYVLAGEVAHGDSMGNKGVIGAGEVQWMTAGSGIIHQEMPKGDPKGRMYGFQLWANLPAANKMMDPRYREVKSGEIPAVKLDGGIVVRVVAGMVAGTTGPVRDIVAGPEYLDVSLPPRTRFTHAVESGRNAFAYVFEGACDFGPDGTTSAVNKTLVRFGKGDTVSAATADGSARFLLVTGTPLGEPVAWGGPIVMNSDAELELAFEEYRNGTFIKHGRKKGT
jgi:quercetin 2,3-dioxygenase